MIQIKTISAYAIPGLKGNHLIPLSRNYSEKVTYIEETVTKYFGVSVMSLKSKSRVQSIAYSRHIVIYFLRKYTSLTLKAIGKMYKRDHTTIINSVQAVKNMIKTDEILRHVVLTIESKVQ